MERRYLLFIGYVFLASFFVLSLLAITAQPSDQAVVVPFYPQEGAKGLTERNDETELQIDTLPTQPSIAQVTEKIVPSSAPPVVEEKTEAPTAPCTQCTNGGECQTEKSARGFHCSCQKPYTGYTCEISPCDASPCMNGGICRVTNESFVCDCAGGTTGKMCNGKLKKFIFVIKS